MSAATRKRRVLFVAAAGSVHAARWIGQLAGQPGIEIHVFDALGNGCHPALEEVTVHALLRTPPEGFRPSGVGDALRLGLAASLSHSGLWVPYGNVRGLERRFMKRFPGLAAWRLGRLIRRLRPDLIHSLEMQTSAQLVAQAKPLAGASFPARWIVSNWGSDISLFARLPEEAEKLRHILAECSHYTCECERDVGLARELGFRGQVLPVNPVGGGYDVERAARLKSGVPPSQRRTIALKGYQNWAGRALVGLEALRRVERSLLRGYRLEVYSADPDVRLATALWSQETGVPAGILPRGTPHDDMLRLHDRSRVSLGFSISDGISHSLLEAMLMGSFPVQSNTCCGDEWLTPGASGLLVPAEDPGAAAEAVSRALREDDLVDRAAELNWEAVRDRLDLRRVRRTVVGYYRRLLSLPPHPSAPGRREEPPRG